MFYFVKTPRWLKKLYNQYTWSLPGTEKIIYLTFDDGPHPVFTPFVLDELKKYEAKASFFCIGKNVAAHPDVYQRIMDEGHAVGNHTYNHLKGWKTPDEEYLANIAAARKLIKTNLFRPPYGRIKGSQARRLITSEFGMKIIMWDVLSGDFDVDLPKEKCLKYVLKNSVAGSVVVFHDSEKANERMCYALPLVLEYFTEKGYSFGKIIG